MSGLLLIEPHGTITKLVLSRPAQRNALNTALLAKLASALEDLARDPVCRVAIITGAGEHFAAGADLGEIEHKTAAEGAIDPRKEHWAAIRSFAKPLIAAVDGFCLGGGFELALMADCLVLGSSARLGLPETNLGLIPGAGGIERLTALIGRARAARMILTGEIIDARTALDWGIAAFSSEGPALATAENLAAQLAKRAPLALATAKAAAIAAAEAPLAGCMQQSRAAFEALLDTEDKTAGISALRAKREAVFQGR
jgi:enoyl-CoA hydratase